MKAIIFDKKPHEYSYLLIPDMNNLVICVTLGRIIAWENPNLSNVDLADKKIVDFPENLGKIALELARAEKAVNARSVEFLEYS